MGGGLAHQSRSKDSFQELGFSFHHVGSGDCQTWPQAPFPAERSCSPVSSGFSFVWGCGCVGPLVGVGFLGVWGIDF